jgi:hypothetical protein
MMGPTTLIMGRNNARKGGNSKGIGGMNIE